LEYLKICGSGNLLFNSSFSLVQDGSVLDTRQMVQMERNGDTVLGRSGDKGLPDAKTNK
jgi:hypothetical protein